VEYVSFSSIIHYSISVTGFCRSLAEIISDKKVYANVTSLASLCIT